MAGEGRFTRDWLPPTSGRRRDPVRPRACPLYEAIPGGKATGEHRGKFALRWRCCCRGGRAPASLPGLSRPEAGRPRPACRRRMSSGTSTRCTPGTHAQCPWPVSPAMTLAQRWPPRPTVRALAERLALIAIAEKRIAVTTALITYDAAWLRRGRTPHRPHRPGPLAPTPLSRRLIVPSGSRMLRLVLDDLRLPALPRGPGCRLRWPPRQ